MIQSYNKIREKSIVEYNYYIYGLMIQVENLAP